jgi:hemerythrin-like domain-containing protein
MNTRRELIVAAGAFLATAAIPLSGAAAEPEVTATEDLMREHGVIRRALLVYAAAVPGLRSNAAAVDAAALRKTGELFRRFAEEYHERQLEERHIFPVIRKMRDVAPYAEVLTKQHERGREITAYLLAVTTSGKVGAAHAASLANALEGLVRMYEHHAAREDTVVFPAWKRNFTNKQLDELGEEFEGIERKTFGHDGFEDAEKTISAIERTFGIADIAQFTPPAPPKA